MKRRVVRESLALPHKEAEARSLKKGSDSGLDPLRAELGCRVSRGVSVPVFVYNKPAAMVHSLNALALNSQARSLCKPEAYRPVCFNWMTIAFTAWKTCVAVLLLSCLVTCNIDSCSFFRLCKPFHVLFHPAFLDLDELFLLLTLNHKIVFSFGVVSIHL